MEELPIKEQFSKLNDYGPVYACFNLAFKYFGFKKDLDFINILMHTSQKLLELVSHLYKLQKKRQNQDSYPFELLMLILGV
jgi:hypothetical protein